VGELASIEGDDIVIRFPVAGIETALKHMPDPPYVYGEEPKFTDLPTFAKEFVRELNREAEDGTTLVHIALDAALTRAIENGAEGVEIVPVEPSNG